MYRIYTYLEDHNDIGRFDYNQPPKSINYIVQLDVRLDAEITMVKGEILQRDYCADYDAPTKTHSDHIVHEDITYTYDVYGFPATRTTVISWYHADGTLDTTPANQKTRHKVYDLANAKKAAAKRRENVVNQLEMDVLGLLVLTQGPSSGHPNAFATVGEALTAGQTYLTGIMTDLLTYQHTGTADLYNTVSADTVTAWFGNPISQSDTIRSYMLESLTQPLGA